MKKLLFKTFFILSLLTISTLLYADDATLTFNFKNFSSDVQHTYTLVPSNFGGGTQSVDLRKGKGVGTVTFNIPRINYISHPTMAIMETDSQRNDVRCVINFVNQYGNNIFYKQASSLPVCNSINLKFSPITGNTSDGYNLIVAAVNQ